MQRLLLVLLITTGAVSLSSCGLFGGGGSDDVATDVPVEEPVIEAAPTTTPPVEASGDGLPGLPQGENGEGVVVSANSPTVIARDLIQSTDPNERAIGVERTRPDPFAGLTIPLVPPQPIEIEGTGNGVASQANGGQAVSSQANGGQAAASANNANNPAEKPVLAEPRLVESTQPEIAALPEIPKPVNAQNVRVSGVIQIGGVPYAIIQAPDEDERYVRQGDRISNDRVLVKRIDTGSGEPNVILVENGIEVERAVTFSDEPVAEDVPPAPEAETVSTVGSLPELPRPAGI